MTEVDHGSGSARPPTAPASDELLRVVEQFTLLLRDSGVPPMAARVFAFALADAAVRHTAGELAAALRVSPAAVSGAVRYLVQTGLLVREREPGTRGDVYCLHGDDVWSRIYGARLPLLRRYRAVASEGADVVGTDTPGGRRLAETAEFFAFMEGEVQALLDRWRDTRSRES